MTGVAGVSRYQKPANPLQYMLSLEQAGARTALKSLSSADLMFDFMLNALRLNGGFAEDLFERRTGLSRSDLLQAAEPAMKKGLIERNDTGLWRPTDTGWRFLNDLQSEFLLDDA
jgi:coproporphyrinogen III oxidase-like Fe-S oxidoreductase